MGAGNPAEAAISFSLGVGTGRVEIKAGVRGGRQILPGPPDRPFGEFTERSHADGYPKEDGSGRRNRGTDHGPDRAAVGGCPSGTKGHFGAEGSVCQSGLEDSEGRPAAAGRKARNRCNRGDCGCAGDRPS